MQGVNFRYYIQKKAEELKIKGFAHNNPDGSLYIEAEGKASELNKFLKDCQQGPISAKVKKIKTAKGRIENFNDFFIKY